MALVGDGGMGMTMAEVETAVREGAHVVAIVFDNERYGMIRDHQDAAGQPDGARHGPRARGLRGGGARLRRAGRPRRDGRGLRAGAPDRPRGVGPDGHPARRGPALGQRGPAGDADADGVTRPTLHLVPEAVWEAHDPAAPYLPAAYAEDGFVHCTDGDDGMVAVANRFYRERSARRSCCSRSTWTGRAARGGSTTRTSATRTSTGRSIRPA